MRDFGVSFKRVPLMCDNTSVISVVKNPVFRKRMRHPEGRHHFLRDHVKKGDIEMRYIDTMRQLADIFTKPLDASLFADLWGKLVFVILMPWFEGEFLLYLAYLYLLLFSCIFSKGLEKVTRGGEWEPIKIPRGNLAYILKSTRCPSLLTRLRPPSYRQAISSRNWVRNCSGNTN
jgi:hypothetical protein